MAEKLECLPSIRIVVDSGPINDLQTQVEQQLETRDKPTLSAEMFHFITCLGI